MSLKKIKLINPDKALQDRIWQESHALFSQIKNQELTSLSFPAGFGLSLPERVIELVLVQWAYRAGEKILDLGNPNAIPCHLSMLQSLPDPKDITGMDIAQPTYNVQSHYNQFISGDATRMEFPDCSFDQIYCISRLEHFGMDNSGYIKKPTEVMVDADFKAFQEMVRILKPKGRLLVTVPYGRFENHQSFIQYDSFRWNKLLESLLNSGYYGQKNSGAAAIAALYFQKKAHS